MELKLLTFGACIDVFTRSTLTVSRLVQVCDPVTSEPSIFLVLYAGNKARVISITQCIRLKIADEN